MAIKKSTYLESEKVIIEVSQELNDKRYLKKSDKASTASGADSLTTSRNIITDLASTVAGSFNGTSSIKADVTGILPTTKGGTGNANGTVAKLTTPRNLKTNLNSSSAANFDGSANVTIDVEGTLPIANGGTGQTALSAVTGVGSALAVSNTVTGSNSANLLYAKVADSDYFRLRVGGTAANAGYVEFATADDYNEPVYVRQYSGEFTTLKRTATLLDASGNTSFPGTVSAAAFSVPGGLAIANGGTGNTIGAAQQFVSLVSDSNSTFRNVWFGSNASSLKAAYDSYFQYNPSTNILNVKNINGTSITISGGMTSSGTIKGAAVSVSGGLLGSSVSVSGIGRCHCCWYFNGRGGKFKFGRRHHNGYS